MTPYPPEFKQFISRCSEKSNGTISAGNFYIGRGNPMSPILFVGQEPSGNDGDSCLSDWIKRSEGHFNGISLENDLPAQHLWRNYQRLYECIVSGESNPHPEHIDFETHVFTTEMSGLVNKQNAEARRMVGHSEQLQWRKDNFFTGEFFKSFKVIVLACGNYLRNDGYNGDWEINRIFDVTFDKNGEHHFSKSNKFYCHHSADGSRLVIHTRNLSSGVSNQMLMDMGRVIREHLERCKNDYIFVKP